MIDRLVAIGENMNERLMQTRIRLGWLTSDKPDEAFLIEASKGKNRPGFRVGHGVSKGLDYLLL